jgi:hypothetical protein
MKIKMFQVFRILDIYTRVKGLKVPAKVAYKFNKLCIDLDADNKFYNEELNKILQQYANKNEDGSFKRTEAGGIDIKEDQIEAAQKEIDGLYNLEVDTPDIKFTVDELDGLELSIEEFNVMLPFIKEE